MFFFILILAFGSRDGQDVLISIYVYQYIDSGVSHV
jgi:hypothetical protein